MSKQGPNEVWFVGGGGHACVMREAAELSARSVVGFFDDDGRSLMSLGTPRVGPLRAFRAAHANPRPLVLAIGDLAIRSQLLEGFSGPAASVVHPAAMVSPRAEIALGCFVAVGAIIGFSSRLGPHCMINSRAIVEHDCQLGQNVHIAPGAVLGGGVQIGNNSLVGLNATVNPSVVVGRNCTVGAGAVVVDDVPDGTTVVGIPARPIGNRWQVRRSA